LATPNDIEIILHYYCTSSPHERIDAPAVLESIEMFKHNEMLYDKQERGCYGLTNKGIAWVQMLQSLPFPRQIYVDQNNKEIIV
jgi:hypothetical protein